MIPAAILTERVGASMGVPLVAVPARHDREVLAVLAVLIVEDSESDALLMVRHLRRSGFEVAYRRVETGAEMREALTGRAWQVVLCDFNLPGFDAGAALGVLQQAGLDIPFIVVSGVVPEATAIGLMRAGARDYVMKDDLARLGPAVSREITEATDRAASARVRIESEMRFRTMLEQNVSAMFLVEDGILTYANKRTGEILGYLAQELVGMTFLKLVAGPDRDAISREMRALADGEQERFDRNFEAVRKDGTLASVGASATCTVLEGRVAIVGSAQDIGERKKAQDEIDRYIQRLESAMQGTLEAVTAMVELRDPYTAGHEHRVGELAAAIAQEMGLSAHAVKGLRITGHVHDLGKICVPAEILSKPSRLTDIEMALIRNHSQAGYDVLKDVDFPWPVAQVILQHHERLDGSGYPRKLRGDEIILEARILAVADVVEAMASHRPYRPGLGIGRALEEIERGSGVVYDALAVEACLRLFRENGYTLPP